jgi:hypothetical protein
MAMVLSEPLVKIVRYAKMAGWFYVALGSLGALCAYTSVSAGYGLRANLRMYVSIAGIYLVQGALLVFLAHRLEAKRSWAAIGIVVVAGTTIANIVLVGMFLGCCGVFANLPCLFLIATSVNALPEIRHLRRSEQRERQRVSGGFAVIMKEAPLPTSMAGVKPPPPARARNREAE